MSCRQLNIEQFQPHIIRFFQQFLTRIVYAEISGIPEDLLNALIAFSLNKDLREDDSTSKHTGVRLFQKSDLYTPELRCIILEQVFREGLVISQLVSRNSLQLTRIM